MGKITESPNRKPAKLSPIAQQPELLVYLLAVDAKDKRTLSNV